MGKMNKVILCLFFFGIACSEVPRKEADRQEIIKKGSELYAKYGCAVCHSLDGKVIYGPPLNGLFMKNIKVIRGGQEFTVVADREYLKKAISEPRYEKVLEYKNKEMPLASFSQEETDILVEYIIALDESNQSGK
jgi:mono/diheme cytochrome c family protein